MSKETWCLTSTETVRLIRDGEKGAGGGMEVSKETWCLTSTETIRLIRDGEKVGEEGMEVGEEGEIIHLSLLCHHQNDSCIKMCSDESRFNVS